MKDEDTLITVKNLSELKDYSFRIPLYQRPYAWKEEHIVQLLEDLRTFVEKTNNENKKYYLGNIVVSKIDEKYDVIDGQQRLTTLFLLLKFIDDIKSFELKYEIREDDNAFLHNFDPTSPPETFAENIQAIQEWQKSNESKLSDLVKKIEVALTIIPSEVDVVKYFEVMNNRGKQLEKHQILKAKFLKILQNDNTYNWAKIWDYCSEIDIPIENLIYYNDFSKEDRKKSDSNDGVFSRLREKLLSFNFDAIESKKGKVFQENDNSENKNPSIKEIIQNGNSKVDKNEDDDNYYTRKEYKSIIRFPIFLIQVLKLFIVKEKTENDSGFKSIDNIIVNDRYLLDYFHSDSNHTKFLFEDQSLAESFILFMFKVRVLFDYFVFKRNEKEEPEFIGREHRDLKKLLMIELLFNVSAPQYFAQDWIAIVLRYLIDKTQENVHSSADITNFESIDQNLTEFLDRFDQKLEKVRMSDVKIIEFINKKIENENIDIEITKELEDLVNQGTSTPYYWFYKLDYLLWKDFISKNKRIWKGFNVIEKADISSFRLSRLNSIEHIQPQNPKQNCREWDNNTCHIDNFGNLALISNHMNSTLINQCFVDKRKDIEKQVQNGTIESLKILLVYSKYKEWNYFNCKAHQSEMMSLLKNENL